MKKQKIILALVLAIVLFMTFIPCVKAEFNLLESTDNNTAIENSITNESNTDNAITDEPSANNQVNNTSTNTNTETNDSSLPGLGVKEDITLVIFIAVCVVSAVYAYIKVRDYRSL